MKKFIIGLTIFLAIVVVGLQVAYSYAYLAPDSFTYFTMARQVYDSGQLFSFSGVDHTTGIHPGFYFFLIPFYYFFSINLPAGSLILGALLLAGAVLLLGDIFGLGAAVIFALGFLTPYGLTLANSGMESSLAVLSLSIVIFIIVKNKIFKLPLPLNYGIALALGGALGLMVFSRLDLIFVIMSILFSISLSRLIYNGWSLKNIKFLAIDLFLIFLPITVFLFTAIGLNLIYGGALLPISGALKSSFPHPSVNWFNNLLTLKIFVLTAILTFGYLLFYWFKYKKNDWLIFSLWTAVLFLGAYNALFASGIGAWYGAFPFAVLLLSLILSWREFGVRLNVWLKSKPILFATFLSLFAVLLIAANLIFISSRVDWVLPHAIAAQYLNTLPAGSAGELKDGVFAFYSKRPVFSLTGLANNEEYVKAVKGGQLRDYFKKHDIAYVVAGSIYSGVQVAGHGTDLTLCHQPIYDQGFVAIFKASDCL